MGRSDYGKSGVCVHMRVHVSTLKSLKTLKRLLSFVMFLIAVAKQLTKSNSREEEFTLAHASKRDMDYPEGKVCQ